MKQKGRDFVMATGDRSYSAIDEMRAWSVHLVTASGAVFGLMALISITQHNWLPAFLWMICAVIADGIDGTLARRCHVKTVLPNFDGALLDNIIDYLNYVIVPAFFLYEASLLPERFALLGAALVTLASAYQFCQGDAKTDDHYFKGFPSYWNVVIFYLFMLSLEPWLNLALILFFCVLVFIPVKYVYPTRTSEHQRLTLFLTLLWGMACLVMMATYPTPPLWLIWASLLYMAYYVGIGFYQQNARGEG